MLATIAQAIAIAAVVIGFGSIAAIVAFAAAVEYSDALEA